MTEIDGRIAQANGRLKAAKVGAAIARVGDRLTIRATLPPKPDSDKDRPYQQRLFLGYHANPTGVKLAEAEARKIGALLDCGDFEWNPYLSEKLDAALTVGDWVTKFEVDYFTRRARTTKSETTRCLASSIRPPPSMGICLSARSHRQSQIPKPESATAWCLGHWRGWLA